MSERVAGILFRIRADTSALRTGMKQANGAISSILKSVNTLGGALGIAFGGYTLKKIGETVLSLVELGGQLKGIEQAFDRLNQPGLLKELRESTRGLVDDMDLMKMVIKAENFKIPLKNLALYFEFATKRATQTGESVQDLIDIIISGVGKQSMKVVKSIGLSVDDWKKTFDETGSFVKTATQMMTAEIEKMGEVTKTEAQNVQSIKIAWQNVRDAMAIEMTASGGINKSLGEFSEKLQGIADFIGTDTFDNLINGFKEVWKWTNRINVATQMTLGLFRGWYLIITKIGGIGGGGQTAAPGKKATLGGGKLSTPILSPVPHMMSELMPNDGKPDYTDYLPKISGWDQYLDTEGYKAVIQTIEENSKHFMSIFQGVGKDVIDVTNEIKNGLMSMIDAFASGIEGLVSGNLGFEDFFKSILQSFGKFLQQMGLAVLSYGIAMQAFKLAFTNPAAAIAAGAALVIIGSIISGLAQRGPSGAGGGGGGSYMQTRHGVSMSAVNIQTTSVMKGKDIYFVNKKYNSYHDSVT